jgi:hypothetical protein
MSRWEATKDREMPVVSDERNNHRGLNAALRLRPHTEWG